MGSYIADEVALLVDSQKFSSVHVCYLAFEVGVSSNPNVDEVKDQTLILLVIPVDYKHSIVWSLIVVVAAKDLEVWIAIHHASTLLPICILVQCNQHLVCDYIQHLWGHINQVSTENKRSLEESPKCEMSSFLCISQVSISDYKHVGVIESARTCILGQG